MVKLYDIQPAACRKPLPKRDYTQYQWYERLTVKHPHFIRVLQFDPKPIYDRLIVSSELFSPYERVNKLKMNVLFPPIENYCSCGCGNLLTGKRTRWADNSCQLFAQAVWAILAGWRDVIKKYVDKHYFIDGRLCCTECGEMYAGIEYDHIIPVHNGGGLSWLSNFQPLCPDCHKSKTKRDFKTIVKKQRSLFDD